LSPGLQDDIATIHPWSRPWSRQRSSELVLLLTCLRDNWEIFAVVLPVEQLEAAPRHRPLMLLKLQTVSRLLLQWPHDCERVEVFYYKKGHYNGGGAG